MIKMDFKGITWAGNVYQKFEAMCLEVEEVMYEDTVKFVENQVQTVGASVKKFYSEVMQDVLPPSSIDPVKVAAADLSLNPYADFSIHKKPKASTKKVTVASNKPVYEDLNMKVEVKENITLELFSKHNRAVAYNAKPKGVIKRKPRRENSLPSEESRSSTPPSRDLNRVSTCQKGENNHVAVDQMDTELCMDKGSDRSGVENLESVASSIASTGDMISPSKSVAKKERQLRDTSGQGQPDVLSARINGAARNFGVDSLIGSYISCDPRNSESDREDSVSPTGECNLDFIESDDDIAEAGPETIQEFDKSNCVVVGREDLSVTAPKEYKPSSYKKKIRKAFSSKWLARQQEYKQLAVQHGCLGTGPNQEVTDSLSPKLINEEKSLPYRVSESEWELL